MNSTSDSRQPRTIPDPMYAPMPEWFLLGVIGVGAAVFIASVLLWIRAAAYVVKWIAT